MSESGVSLNLPSQLHSQLFNTSCEISAVLRSVHGPQMAEPLPGTTWPPFHVGSSSKLELYLSLYLVTGRDLLPHGMVPFEISPFFFADSFSRVT